MDNDVNMQRKNKLKTGSTRSNIKTKGGEKGAKTGDRLVFLAFETKKHASLFLLSLRHLLSVSVLT